MKRADSESVLRFAYDAQFSSYVPTNILLLYRFFLGSYWIILFLAVPGDCEFLTSFFLLVLLERKDSVAVAFVKHRKEKFRKMQEVWAAAKERKLHEHKS